MLVFKELLWGVTVQITPYLCVWINKLKTPDLQHTYYSWLLWLCLFAVIYLLTGSSEMIWNISHTHAHKKVIEIDRDIQMLYLYGKKISVVIKNTAYSNDLSRFYYVFTTVSNTTFSISHNILNILFFPCPAG